MTGEGVMKKLVLLVVVIIVIYSIFGANADKSPKPKAEYIQGGGLENNTRDIRETLDIAIDMLSNSMNALRRSWQSKPEDN